jgi:hypothetical protein
MNVQRGRLLLGCITGLVAASLVAGQEKRISESELPAAVKKSAGEQSRGAKVLGYSKEVEHKKTCYELEMKVNGHAKDVLMDASGAVVEVEEEVSLDSLSPAVKDGLEKAAGSGQIMKVESLTKRGTLVAYEAQVRSGQKRSEVQVGPNGEILARAE